MTNHIARFEKAVEINTLLETNTNRFKKQLEKAPLNLLTQDSCIYYAAQQNDDFGNIDHVQFYQHHNW